MKAVVVYDSVFGNTEKVAKAIAESLESQGEAKMFHVKKITPEQMQGINLLVVGSPTRGFQPTKDMKDFLGGLANGSLNGVKVAAFDTRMDVKQVNNGFLTFMSGIFGYAAAPIAGRLKKKGGQAVAEPEGFIVNASEGPLRDGELERAAAWAKKVGSN